MDAKVTWKEGLSFTGTADSGFEINLGTSVESGGANDGLRPLELLIIGLAGCTGMDVISILKKKKQDVIAFEVKVHAERATEHPRVFTHLLIEYQVSGRQVDPAAVERAVELSKTKYCSVQAILAKGCPIDHKIIITEAGE